jgi:hypothetical protein
MRTAILILFLSVAAFAQPTPKRPCRTATDVSCTPQVGADGTTVLPGNVVIASTCPEGAPAGSVCIGGKIYQDGVEFTGGGGGGINTFLQCAGPCAVGEHTNWPLIAMGSGAITECVIGAASYPTGSDVTVVILKNPTISVDASMIVTISGGTSIFSGDPLTLTAGETVFRTVNAMSAGASYAKGDYYMALVTAQGSTSPGKGVIARCANTGGL